MGEIHAILATAAPPAALKDTKSLFLCDILFGVDGHLPKNAKLKN